MDLRSLTIWSFSVDLKLSLLNWCVNFDFCSKKFFFNPREVFKLNLFILEEQRTKFIIWYRNCKKNVFNLIVDEVLNYLKLLKQANEITKQVNVAISGVNACKDDF